MVKYSIYLIC